jgi:hypothetical protein
VAPARLVAAAYVLDPPRAEGALPYTYRKIKLKVSPIWEVPDRVVSPSNIGRCWNVQSNVAMLLLTWVISHAFPSPLQETQQKQPNIEVKKTNKNQTESLIAHDPSMLSNYSIDLVRGPAALCRVFKTTLPVDAYRFQNKSTTLQDEIIDQVFIHQRGT